MFTPETRRTQSFTGPVPAFHCSLFIVLLTVALLTACASQPLTVTHEPVTLRLAATDTCGPLIEGLAAAYHEERPWVTVRVEVFNDAVVGERLQAGSAHLAVLSWLGEGGEELWSVPFAADDVAVVVHPAVPVEELGLAELREVFRGRIGEWSNGTPIQVVSREEGAGVRAVFESLVMGGYDVTLTALVAPDTGGVLKAVATTPGAIGYISWSWPKDTVRALSIEGVPPGADSYPLRYALYLAARSEPEGEARDFIQWVLGPEGQERVRRYLGPAP